MALIDKASLLMVPSTYEAGKLYNVLPSGNRAPDSTDQNSGYDQTRADFDFDRGSNAAATRIDSNGVLQKYRENTLLQSNQFDTTWQTSGTTPLSGYADRNGGTDAWLLREDATTSNHWIRQSSGLYSGIGTFSFYAKKKDYDYIQFARSGDGGDYANFNISNGTLGNVSGASIIDRKIESVGNGWYRCSVTYIFGSNSFVGIALIRSDVSTRYESYLGNGTSGTYIQDAQVETGLVASSYLDSTSVTAKAGVLVDLPRINYDANGENGSLLLEPSRANLVTQSEYFGSGWSLLSGGSFAFNQTTSPEGVQNASTLSGDGVNANAAYFSASVTSGTAYAFSIYAKQNGQSLLRMRGFSPAAGGNVIFDLSDGTINTQPSDDFSNAKIEAVGTDGWYRCSVIATADATNSGALFGFDYSDSSASGGLFYVWGAQFEAGSYVSSYIPNHGTSGGVTRAADITDRGANLSYTGDYTLFMEFNLTEDAAYILNATTLSAWSMYVEGSFAGFQFGRTGGDAGSVSFASSFDWSAAIGTNVKIALVKNGTSVAMFVNGTKYTPSANTLSTGNEVLDWRYLNYTTTTTRHKQNYINQLLEFEQALSDAECVTLTTL